MKVDIKKLLESRSYRVKGVDVHPTEPLIVASLFTGTVQVWNYETGEVVRQAEVSKSPVRACRFIARKNWIVVGGDDMQIRVFNAATMERIAQFEAHLDYIRFLVVHPTLPVLLSTGDDMVVKMWDWDQGWRNTQTFRGHTSYVLGLAINPKDPSQFASASMDRTVKVWSIDSPAPNYTLVAHETRGVNYVEYYPFADKPYLLTTSDDRTIRIFDYQSKNVIATLSGHTHNVSFAMWHQELPLIVSGSEDSTLKLWNARSYKLEQTLNYGMERAWCVAARPNSNIMAVGFETGSLVLRLGHDEPVVSLDHSGKLVWAKHLEAFAATIKAPAAENDGAVHLQSRDLGTVERQPHLLTHSPDGRFVAVVGDGEYVIYTPLSWRNKFFGAALDFSWGPDSSYAVLERPGQVVVLRDYEPAFEPSVPGATRVFGGELLGVATSNALVFFDWTSGQQVAIIDVPAQSVAWAESGELVAIITEESTYVLSVDTDRIDAGIEAGETELEGAFSEVAELAREPVRSAAWVGDCLVYTTQSNRLNYLVGTKTYNLSHYDRDMYVLRYLARDSAVYLVDKDVRVVSHALSLAVVEFQTAVLRGDVSDAMSELLPAVPESERTRMARFLEAQGFTDLALEITRDDEHKFELALSLHQLGLAASIAKPEETAKWRKLGDYYLGEWNVDAATDAYTKAGDLETLLLIHTSTGNTSALTDTAKRAETEGKYNLAFNALWALGDAVGATNLLNKSGRHSEAALFALTYGVPVDDSVKQWKDELVAHDRANIAEMLAVPTQTKPAVAAAAPANASADVSVPTEEPVAPAAASEAAPEEPKQTKGKSKKAKQTATETKNDKKEKPAPAADDKSSESNIKTEEPESAEPVVAASENADEAEA